MTYIQTIQSVDMYDGRCLAVRFYSVPEVLEHINMESHTSSYLHEREQEKEFGELMGLDTLLLRGEND